MASTNTTVENGHPWYYYIENDSDGGSINIFDHCGTAITDAGIDIRLEYSGNLQKLEDDDDVIPLNADILIGVAKGVAYDILQMENIVRRDLRKDYMDALKKEMHRSVKNKYSPAVVKPISIVPKRAG